MLSRTVMKRITSRHHPLVAACRALGRRRAETPERILLDGLHLVEEAYRAGVPVETAAVAPTILDRPDGAQLARALQQAGAEVVEVSESVLQAMSPVSTPSGIVAIARRPASSLAAVLAGRPQLVLVGIDIQDPGNVGAMARAAEAAGATGVAFAGASADPFGWKALRGSMGSLLRLPAASNLPWQEVLAGARAAGVHIVATQPRGGAPLYDLDLRGPVAFLLGGEGPGLPDEVLAAADAGVSIPMHSPVESLNVSVAAAVLLYEAARQRRTPGVVS